MVEGTSSGESGTESHPSSTTDPSLVFFFFWPHLAACRILVPWPGMEPTPPAVEAWNLNHWTAREVPTVGFWTSFFSCLSHIFHIHEIGGEAVGDFVSIFLKYFFDYVSTSSLQGLILGIVGLRESNLVKRRITFQFSFYPSDYKAKRNSHLVACVSSTALYTCHFPL